MARAHLLIFDDGFGKWGPMNDMRAVFELLTGAVSTQRRIERVLQRPAIALDASASLQNLLGQRVTPP